MLAVVVVRPAADALAAQTREPLRIPRAVALGVAGALASVALDAGGGAGPAQTASLSPSFAVAAGAFAPLAEEVFFRHLLLALFDAKVPRPVSTLTTALVFATAHAESDTRVLLQLASLGVVFAYAYRACGGWRASFASHAAYNAAMLAAALVL